MKLICICPSRRRPNELKTMMESFFRTKTFAELFVYIDEEDPKLEDYKKVFEGFSFTNFEIGHHKYMVTVVNYACLKFNADYYQLIHDDFVFLKEGWDKEMCDAAGDATSYTFERDDPGKNPMAEVYSKKIINDLGYMFYPKFRQCYIEPYSKSIMEFYGTKCVENVIEHRCFHGLNRMAKDTDNYEVDEPRGIEIDAEWQKIKGEILK
jgi:hypothetical protein